MQAPPIESTETLARLDRLASCSSLAARDAARCAHLAEVLRKPVRVCLMGPAQSDLRTLLYGILGIDIAPDGLSLPSAIEMRLGDCVQTLATLEDGTHLSNDGWPDAELLAEAPVFLQLDAPAQALERMSFLALSLEADPAVHRPALSWAARRTDIAVWCTRNFSSSDAGIWANAPERLTHHAYLVETAPDQDAPHHRLQHSFTGYMPLPLPSTLEPLLDQLGRDIDEARMADIDAAQVLLHRLGPFDQEQSKAVETVESAPPPDPLRSHGQLTRLREVLSEPTLYLSRRARALAQDLSWTDPQEEPDWFETALAHITETTEGLRDRTLGWPDDLTEFTHLADMVEEATDLILLLQVEAGPDQVEDAAGLLHQLRLAFDGCRLGEGIAA